MTRLQMYGRSGQLLYGQTRQGMSSWDTRYVYLGGKLIAESIGLSNVYVHTDALGSPVARTNAAGGLISRTRYEPYGATAAGTNPGSDGSTGIGFTGHVNDAESGLVYMQQRYYDPIAGRFLSVDPVTTDTATGSSFNRYVYGNNSPYKFKDPDGRHPILPFIAFGLAVNEITTSDVPIVGGGVAKSAGKAAETILESAAKPAGVQANRVAGDAFQNKVAAEIKATRTDVAQEVTIKTDSGTKTRMDILSRDADGKIICTECKSSATAPLTRNQAIAHPEISETGGVVVGKGKPGFPGGTVIPPQTVEVKRP